MKTTDTMYKIMVKENRLKVLTERGKDVGVCRRLEREIRNLKKTL